MRAYAWSPIWGALAQGWRDNIQRETDEVHPPFAYGSGMGWRDEKGNDYFAEDEDAPSKESEEASMEREIDIGEGIDFAKLILQM